MGADGIVMTGRAADPSVTWWQRRIAELSRLIEAGEYFVPADDVAAAILFGRPKWGDNPVATENKRPAEQP